MPEPINNFIFYTEDDGYIILPEPPIKKKMAVSSVEKEQPQPEKEQPSEIDNIVNKIKSQL